MANAIDLITKFSSKAWDKVYQAESRSALLDGDKDLLRFTGVKTVKIAKFTSGGLSDYRRANNPVTGGDYAGFTAGTSQGYGYGYNQADASLVWEEFTISCDRAAQFRVELFDDEETDGLAVAATTTDVSRTQVIPEVDAYCFSKIAEYAGKVDTTSWSAGKPLTALNDAFKALEDAEVPEEDQIIFCSTKYRNELRNSTEITKFINQADYDKNIKFTIEEYEGRKLVTVPPRRFRTDISLQQGGYTWGANSVEIDFIVCAKSAIYHVTKYDKVRVFSPAVVQDFDGYKINIRVYHDVFVPENKRPAIYVHTTNNAQFGYTLNYNINSSKVVTGAICLGCPDIVKYYAVADGDAGYANLAIGGAVPSTSATCVAITVGTTALTADKWKIVAKGNNGKIVAMTAEITIS